MHPTKELRKGSKFLEKLAINCAEKSRGRRAHGGGRPASYARPTANGLALQRPCIV